MPEEDPLVRRHVVLAVVEPVRWSYSRVIERHHLRREEGGVVAVANGGHREEEEDERQGVHVCADSKGIPGSRGGAETRREM